MSVSRPLIRFVLLIAAIAITTLIMLFVMQEQLMTLNTPGDSTFNSVPAIRISLAGKPESSPSSAPAPEAIQPPAQPEPQIEPEPTIVRELEPAPKKTTISTPAPTIKKPVHSTPTAPKHSEPNADPTTGIATGELNTSSQIELHAGTSAAIDNYLSQLRRHLSKFYEYPRRARRLGQEGMPVIVFCFRRDGSLTEHYLQDSSGHELLDKAALDMLEQAAPLPPVPNGMAGRQFSYALPVRFSLR